MRRPTNHRNPKGRPFRGPRPQHQGNRPNPSPEAMRRMLDEAEISLSDSQVAQLWAFHNLIRKHNEDRELTRIIGFEPMVVKHYIDCMIVGNLWRLPSPIVDVGTGAGFPGVPLKIRYPNLQMILAEPRPKRIEFLELVVKELKLQNTTIFEHKVVSRSFTTPVKAVITRAVETMDKTALRTSAALEIGGQIIFLKGPNADDEIQVMKERFGDAFALLADKKYALPGTPHDRRLVVYEKKRALPTRAESAELQDD